MSIKTIACVLGAAVLVGACSATAPDGEGPGRGGARAIGTFDSRAVAAAYYRSKGFGERVSALRARLAEAKAAGDAKRVAELNAQGPAMQARAHRQTFCATPIPDVLEHVRDTLPAIAERAGVGTIMSRWDVAWQDPSVRTVDVTDLIVAVFDPDEATLKVISDLREQEPLPVEALTGHDR